MSFNSILQLSDHDFVLAGLSNAFGSAEPAVVIVKMAGDGRIKWQKMYGKGEAQVIRQTSDGGYFAAASVRRGGDSSSLLLKIDSAGVAQWHKQYHGSVHAVEQTADNGFLLAGELKRQGWLLKLDAQGEPQWQKKYGGDFDGSFATLRKTEEGKLVILGSAKTNNDAASEDIWLLQVAEDGTIDWQKTIGGRQADRPRDLQRTRDGGYLIAGATMSFGPGSVDRALLLKVDGTGEIPGCTLPSFSASLAAGEDIELLYSDRPFETPGQDLSFAFNNSAVPSFSPSVSAASYCPPEPKLVVHAARARTDKKDAAGGSRPSQVTMRVRNTGAVDLTIREMQITQSDRSAFAFLWNWLPGQGQQVFPVIHTSQQIASGKDCDFTVELPSRFSGETHAVLTITSNDPDVPVTTVPLEVKPR